MDSASGRIGMLRKAAVTWLLACATALAQSPTPAEPPSPVKLLAIEIAKAESDAAREELLKRAEPEWLTSHALRKELAAIESKTKLDGDYLRAESLGRLMIRLARDQGDEEGIASGKVQLAGSLRESAAHIEAMQLLREALAYYEKNPEDSRGLLRAHHWIGVLHMYGSDFARALTHLDRALTLGKEIGFREAVIPALNSMGNVYRLQGQPERALRVYEQARESVGDDAAWNMAFIFNNMGQAHEAMGEIDRAIEYIHRAKAVAEKSKMRPRIATSLAVLGNLHLRRNELDEAEKSYRESLTLSVELRDIASEARALLGLAEVSRLRGTAEAALEPASRAAELYRSMGQRAEVAAAQTTIGRCYRALGRTDDARIAFDEAISQTERVRTQVAGGVTEAEAFFATKLAPYHEMVAMLVAEDRAADALQMSERASGRVLLDILARGKREQAGTLGESELNEERRLARRVAELNQRLKQARDAGQRDDDQIRRLTAELAGARDDIESFQAKLSASQFATAGQTRLPTEVASEEEIARIVADRKTALLKFVVGEEETLLFVVGHGAAAAGGDSDSRTELFRIALKQDELRRRAADFRGKLASRALDWQKPAAELFDALLKSSEASWKHAEKLVIIPDGPLWELPFQVLQSGKRSLLEDRRISYAPSISFLARSRTETSPDAAPESRLLAVGNPSLGGDRQAEAASSAATLMGDEWKPLPDAEKQVAALAKIYAQASSTFIGPSAREQAVKDEAGKFDILHFATHGVLNDAAPLYSYLLLSQENLAAGEDGMLEAWELMRLKLRSRLAILSACETARGRVSPGEGIVGLSWAMLVAGCPATVVSQWKVDSASNTPLMISFHQRLHGGAAPAEALRQASLELAKSREYRHPFYWAPFVVVGAGL